MTQRLNPAMAMLEIDTHPNPDLSRTHTHRDGPGLHADVTQLPILMNNKLLLIVELLRRSVRGLGRVLCGTADERLDRYLEQAVDHADLKRRQQNWQASERHEAVTRLIPQRH